MRNVFAVLVVLAIVGCGGKPAEPARSVGPTESTLTTRDPDVLRKELWGAHVDRVRARMGVPDQVEFGDQAAPPEGTAYWTYGKGPDRVVIHFNRYIVADVVKPK
jgi:hypothetical protein